MALQSITTYTTQAKVERVLSEAGLLSRVDHDASGTIDDGTDADETTLVTESIEEASEIINWYCYQRYTPANLAISNWVSRACTWIAAYCFCEGLRGNAAPESIVTRYEDWVAKLEQVLENGGKIPGIPERSVLAPAYSNTRVDPRYRFKAIRKERGTSTQDKGRVLKEQVDYREQYSFDEYII